MHEYRRLQLDQAALRASNRAEGYSYEGLESGVNDLTTTDLDAFLAGVHRYFLEKGFKSVISRSLANVFTSMFTFVLAVVVLLLIDWPGVLTCTSEDSCSHASVFHSNPIFPLTLYRFFILVQLVPMGFYTVVVSVLSCVAKIREAVRVSKFFREALYVEDDEELHFIPWSEIVLRISQYQASSTAPLCIVQETLTPLEIHNILMRTENMTLSINKRWLKDVSAHSSDSLNRLYLSLPLQSRAFQWCIEHGLVAWLYDDRYRFRKDIVTGTFASNVRSRIRLIGFASLALMGPLAIFAVILLFVQESDDVRSRRYSLFEKEWTIVARSVLRNFGESRDALSHRLRQGKESAEKFSEQIIKNKSNESIMRSLKFTSAGCLAVLALIAVVQDAALLHLTIAGKSLLFYFAILSGIVAFCSGFEPDAKLKVSVSEKVCAGLGLLGSMHVDFSLPVPATNARQSDLLQAREADSMSSEFGLLFFRPKLVSLLAEVVGIVLLPLFFLRVLPDRLSDIVVNTRIISSESLGDFAAEGFLSAGISPGQSEEMTTAVAGQVTFSSLRNTGRTCSLIMFMSDYGLRAGLTKEQVDQFSIIETFMKSCMQSDKLPSLKLHESLHNNPWFWYLVFRELTMSSGNASLIRMMPGLAAVGAKGLRALASTAAGA